jgi:hypothetical protein
MKRAGVYLVAIILTGFFGAVMDVVTGRPQYLLMSVFLVFAVQGIKRLMEIRKFRK